MSSKESYTQATKVYPPDLNLNAKLESKSRQIILNSSKNDKEWNQRSVNVNVQSLK